MIKKVKLICIFVLLLFPSIAFTDIYRDKETDLDWYTVIGTPHSWNEAKEYCQDLKDDEYINWYLPSLYELKSLVDYDKYNPAIKSELINIKLGVYWSSSSYIGQKFNFWIVDFKSGKNDWNSGKDNKYYTLCVHKKLKKEK